MRTSACLAISAALVSCSSSTTPQDIAAAEELCAKRGSYASVKRYERGAQLIINCKDGTHINVRLAKGN